MSRKNKVNRDHYVQRGRLTPDEAARERVKQRPSSARAPGPSSTDKRNRPSGLPKEPSSPPGDEAGAEDRQEENTGADKRPD